MTNLIVDSIRAGLEKNSYPNLTFFRKDFVEESRYETVPTPLMLCMDAEKEVEMKEVRMAPIAMTTVLTEVEQLRRYHRK